MTNARSAKATAEDRRRSSSHIDQVLSTIEGQYIDLAGERRLVALVDVVLGTYADRSHALDASAKAADRVATLRAARDSTVRLAAEAMRLMCLLGPARAAVAGARKPAIELHEAVESFYNSGVLQRFVTASETAVEGLANANSRGRPKRTALQLTIAELCHIYDRCAPKSIEAIPPAARRRARAAYQNDRAEFVQQCLEIGGIPGPGGPIGAGSHRSRLQRTVQECPICAECCQVLLKEEEAVVKLKKLEEDRRPPEERTAIALGREDLLWQSGCDEMRDLIAVAQSAWGAGLQERP